jgi:hypothetical protein
MNHTCEEPRSGRAINKINKIGPFEMGGILVPLDALRLSLDAASLCSGPFDSALKNGLP